MTLEQFTKAEFSADTKIKIYNYVYDIFSVDFEQSLIGIIQFPEEENDMDKVRWIRFENCEIFTEEMEAKEIAEKTDRNMALISAFAEHYKNETLKTIPEEIILSFFDA